MLVFMDEGRMPSLLRNVAADLQKLCYKDALGLRKM